MIGYAPGSVFLESQQHLKIIPILIGFLVCILDTLKQVQAMGDRWTRKKARDEAKVAAEVAQVLLDLASPTYGFDQATKNAGTQTDISTDMV